MASIINLRSQKSRNTQQAPGKKPRVHTIGVGDVRADYLPWHMCCPFCASSGLTRSSRSKCTISNGSPTHALSSPYLSERPINLGVRSFLTVFKGGILTSNWTGVKPFYLHMFPPHLAHLCPIRALAHWLYVSGITDGYLFRKIASGDRVSTQNSHMVWFIHEHILESLQSFLLDERVFP